MSGGGDTGNGGCGSRSGVEGQGKGEGKGSGERDEEGARLTSSLCRGDGYRYQYFELGVKILKRAENCRVGLQTLLSLPHNHVLITHAYVSHKQGSLTAVDVNIAFTNTVLSAIDQVRRDPTTPLT